FFFFSSRRRHTRSLRDWSSDMCSSDLLYKPDGQGVRATRFLEIGIIDHHTFDAWVGLEEIGDELLPAGRPTITAVFDVYTGCVRSEERRVGKECRCWWWRAE